MINVQNISSKLASLPDQALKQYAEMHKDDPYVFSLALSESNRRKEMRSQAQQAMPQPKVVDKELEDMDIRKALPEDLGIARIPVDMNMASGGIVAFDDGGMTHYDKGGDVKNAGSDPKLAYRQYALTQASKMGLDPALVDSIFQIESKYDPDAKSPTGPIGIGQLTKATGKAYGVDPKDRKDPYKNIDASLAFMVDLNKKYSGDPSKIAVAYNQGEPVLDKHLRANQGELNVSTLPKEARGYVKKLTDLLPISAANAEAIAQPASQATPQTPEVDRSFTGQLKSIGQGIAGIPGAIGNVVAPEGAGGYEPGTRNFFERSADVVGIPENYQRNISNTLNAVSGLPSPTKIAPLVGKLSPAAQAAKVAGETDVTAAAQKAAAAEAKIANLRLPAPASTRQGIEALTEEERVRRGLGTPVVPAKPLPDVNTLSEAERLKRGLSPRGPVYPLGPDAIKMQQELLARRGQVGNIGAKAPSGIEALTPKAPPKTFPIGQEAAEMNQKMQAARQAQALRNLEADKAAAEAARKGVTEATDASKAAQAVDAVQASKVANAANKVITPVNKAVTTAREVQAARNLNTAADKVSFGSDDTGYQPDYQPDTSRGYPAPVSPAIDDRTKRDPANYKPEEKKQIIAAAKEVLPKSEDTDGWSKNDWLQFGLAMMAGQSPNALSNIGAAGLAVIANKAEKAKEQNKLDLYKSVHGEKPGQSIQIAERLMAANPNLSFEDALARATELTGGSTKEALAGTRADAVTAQNYKTWLAAKEKIDSGMVGIIGKSSTATPAQKKAYADAIAALGPNPMGDTVATPTAPAASPIKVLGVRPNP